MKRKIPSNLHSLSIIKLPQASLILSTYSYYSKLLLRLIFCLVFKYYNIFCVLFKHLALETGVLEDPASCEYFVQFLLFLTMSPASCLCLNSVMMPIIVLQNGTENWKRIGIIFDSGTNNEQVATCYARRCYAYALKII